MRKKSLILFFLCSASVFTVAYLSGKGTENALYSLLICAFFGICFGLSDFMGVYRAHKKLLETYNALSSSPIETEAFGGIIGEDYTEIIRLLSEKLAGTVSDMRQRETEAKDYYTLWTHQIKIPIAAMKLILDSGSTDISLLKNELFRIEQYSEMALGYIRLESIREDLLLKRYNVRDIAAAALKKYVTVFSLKKLSLDFEDFELFAVTDEKWTGFVIEQLLSNSIKYTKSGGISIRAENNRLIISDTGTGISEEDLPRIFERGFTGYNGRMDRKATGLGLYLCRKITGILGHKLEISSEKGVGTTVSVDFSQDDSSLQK